MDLQSISLSQPNLAQAVNIFIVIPAHDCRDAGGRAMHGAIAEAGIQRQTMHGDKSTDWYSTIPDIFTSKRLSDGLDPRLRGDDGKVSLDAVVRSSFADAVRSYPN
jgi:hypothetical protein